MTDWEKLRACSSRRGRDGPQAIDEKARWRTSGAGSRAGPHRRRALCAFSSRRLQPSLANLLMLGPTGTGKTELAKALAGLSSVTKAMLRFDCSELSGEHS